MTGAVVVFITAPNVREGNRLARVLVGERLAACVNRVDSVRSTFRWKGRVETARECLLMAKTTGARFPALQKRIRALHPYRVPEVIACPLSAGSAPYLSWIAHSVCRPVAGEGMRIPFVLASGSPRRKSLLRRVVPRFRVKVSGVTEPDPRPGENVRDYVVRLARRKALSVAPQVRRGFLLGADTVVFRRGKIYGKPRDRQEARQILSELAGKWHDVYTGLALVFCPGRRVWTGVYRTSVQMRSFSPNDLTRLSAKNHDKAGAYAAQARGNPFVLRYRGDFDNVVGLPTRGVRELLKKAEGAVEDFF